MQIVNDTQIIETVTEYYHINQTLKKVQEKRDTTNKSLKSMLTVPDKYDVGKYLVTVSKCTNKTLSRDKLLSLGISEDTLNKAIIETAFDKILIKQK